MEDRCFPCDVASGRSSVPGGQIHRTGHWIVDHCVGPLGVGTLIVKPERHIVHVADMKGDEAAELGPLLRDAARVTTRLTRPEQVYVTLWSHSGGVPGHIHYVIQPVTRAIIDEFGYGASMQPAMFAANRQPDPDEVRAFAEAARALFRSH